MSNVVAVILAGGQGKGMGVLCCHRAKPALRFAGDYRLIDFVLSNCVYSGIVDVAAVVDYQRSFLTGYLQRWWQKAGSGMQLDALGAESHYLGTADAVYQNLDYFKKLGSNTAIVIPADHVYKMDYRPMVDFHRQANADVTVGVVAMPREKARRFGTLEVDAAGRILDFTQETDHSASNLVSMGIGVFNFDSLIGYLSRDAALPDSQHDLGSSIVPRMVQERKVVAFRFDDYWRDIGTTEAYYWANMELARGATGFNLEGRNPVLTVRQSLPQPEVSARARVHHSVLSAGCSIDGYVENSIIGPGVRIEAHSVVRNSVLMDDVFVGERSVVQSCIIDEGMSIGECCEIGAKDRMAFASNPIAVLGNDSAPRSLRSYGRDRGDKRWDEGSGLEGLSRLRQLNAELKD